MSSFFIGSIASMTRPAFAGSGSMTMSGRTVGTTCHHMPYLSFSRPYCWPSRPRPPRAGSSRVGLRLALGLRRVGYEQVHLARSLEARLDIVPIPGIPDRLEERRLLVLVLEVVGMLPGIDHEKGNSALAQIRLVIVYLARQEALRDRLIHECAPTRAHYRGGDLGELRLERLEATEVALDRARQLARRTVAPLGSHVLPEDRVQDVTGKVEGQRLLEARDPREVLLLTSLVHLLERLVGLGDVGVVVLSVVELHDVPRDVRFEGTKVVFQVRKYVACHGNPPGLPSDCAAQLVLMAPGPIVGRTGRRPRHGQTASTYRQAACPHPQWLPCVFPFAQSSEQ